METEKITEVLNQIIEAKKELLNEVQAINEIAQKIVESLRNGNKILICGNGGSAADAQHIAGELVGKFKRERKAIPAIALTTDSSIITSISNDLEFDTVFARQVEAHANAGDILLGISTSGNSKNVLNAFKKGKEHGTINISLTGKNGGNLKKISDLNISVASDDTPIIQDCHMSIYHIICDIVEQGVKE